MLLFDNVSDRIDPMLLGRMSDAMIHRGPDAAGTWIGSDRRVGLAHRRLSIVDLSDAADQPMTSGDGSLVLCFNGEIYNHAELRKELSAQGAGPWCTDHSDTEVILHAYRAWGRSCLDRFIGMFAFGLWDVRERELWLVRDRMGVKPLYFAIDSRGIAFASEIKALLEDPTRRREVNPEAMYHFLSFLTTPAPKTMFSGIEKLECGTWMRVSTEGRVERHRWWDALSSSTPQPGISSGEASETLIETLREAVSLRKVSDVPVGIFLSGGVDSSTNAALFAETETSGASQVKTFSIGYADSTATYENEFKWAREVADYFGTDHHERTLELNDLLRFLPRMIRLQDEPIADPVCVPVYYVSDLARKSGVIVCQVGEGADELFWGYPKWRSALERERASRWPIPRFFKRLAVGGLGAIGRDSGFRFEWLRRSAAGLPTFWGGAEAFPDRIKRRMLSPAMQSELSGITSWDALAPIWDRFEKSAWEPSPLAWMSYLDLNLRLPELLLMRVDKMSMGASVEARVPFLDHRVVELALGLPESVKTEGGVLKGVLKRAVRGMLPDEVVDRPKQGFGVPSEQWFRYRLRDFARSEIRRFCEESGLLQWREVDRVEQEIESFSWSHTWYLLNLALWWREYIAEDSIPELEMNRLGSGNSRFA
ncbi:MAG: asparagine synthase (glutamine-hydrolyzing) [Acidobacteria bacterium]|nr:MAG: asparagine synthase (glutamine-hydrolyzing) [Acidobacteriota bacterium]